MKFKRSAGILLHPTSLPGPYGIGDLGPEAHRWVDYLAKSGTGLWQVLPLGPTGYGDSPYQCFSAVAGNPYLISPDLLIEEGLLQKEDLEPRPDFPEDRVDFGPVIVWKIAILDKAFDSFQRAGKAQLRAELDEFVRKNDAWLEDFGLFMALKDAHGGAQWTNWEPDLRDRYPRSLEEARQKYALTIARHKFRQFFFFRQWSALRAHAIRLGIKIIGDIPIFVAHDSADVWVHPELFYLDEEGHPTVVAGVPPDYFSPTGQLWGNPLYRWDLHAASGYSWWLDRIRAVLDLVDFIRLDHFRGFAGYWEVPGKAENAIGGHWVTGPGPHFFTSLRAALGDLPIIAEDLGEITPDVVALREQFSLPGMKILQFAFTCDPRDPFLPHNYPVNCVVYSGTHDNDTASGWYVRLPEKEREFCRRYLHSNGTNIPWDMIWAAWSSVAVFALAPMQDFLNLGNEARMNYPGNPSGNWSWRMKEQAMSPELLEQIKDINFFFLRDKDSKPVKSVSEQPKAEA